MSTNVFQLTKHFSVREFKCHDGTDVPPELVPYAHVLAEQLEIIRAVDNQWINVLSGFRTFDYNKKVGGKKASFHLACMAADIVKHHVRVTELYRQILTLIAQRKIIEGGVGIYDSFVHYDVRGYKARWDERTT
jgi:uncharacterized protein YcbK (DUF882 family)